MIQYILQEEELAKLDVIQLKGYLAWLKELKNNNKKALLNNQNKLKKIRGGLLKKKIQKKKKADEKALEVIRNKIKNLG